MRFIRMIFLLIVLGCSKPTDSSLSSSKSSNLVDSRLRSLIVNDDIDSLIVTNDFRLDSVDFNIITFDSSSHIFPRTFNASGLSDDDVKKCEALLRCFVDWYNTGTAKKRFDETAVANPDLKLDIEDFTIDLKDYGRQYVAGISEDGTKIIHVNCFCSPNKFDYRDKRLVQVYDGGNCYFNFMINLTEQEIFNIWVNGYA